MIRDRIFDGLTFDDILLVPGYAEIHPSEVSLKSKLTRKLECNIPLLSAAMDTVTEADTAICMAQEGGLGVIHKNLSIEEQANQVNRVKRSESGMITNPITIEPDQPISEALKLMERYRISGVPVILGTELVGILTNRDLRFESNHEKPVSELMTGGRDKLVTVAPGIEMEAAKRLLHQHRIEKLLVVNANYELQGLITIKDIEKARKYPNANKDEVGRLLVGAALGVSEDLLQRAEALIQAEVDLVVLDSAHGHSQGVLEGIRKLRSHFPEL
ncbi:MAG: IMP dehydrogenase, partial [SAR324 cluster bacterium]|nr:IMP dehydrogenase [SAR324 cluster bacterium]